MSTVYILYSASKSNYYIGFTGDNIAGRLRKHNSNHKGFTGTSPDWKIVYKEEYLLKNDTMFREIQIKKWKSKKMIEKIIDSEHYDV